MLAAYYASIDFLHCPAWTAPSEFFFAEGNADVRFFKAFPFGDILRLLLALRIRVSEIHHCGVMYWARVAEFDVTIGPLLPRSCRDFQVEADRRLRFQGASPKKQGSSLQRCRLPMSSGSTGRMSLQVRLYAVRCRRGAKSRAAKEWTEREV